MWGLGKLVGVSPLLLPRGSWVQTQNVSQPVAQSPHSLSHLSLKCLPWARSVLKLVHQQLLVNMSLQDWTGPGPTNLISSA